MTVTIRSRQEGFRRCGVAHPKNLTEYPDYKFTKKELKILEAEPMLTVKQKAKQPDAPTPREKKIFDVMKEILKTGKNLIKEGKPDVKAIEKIVGFDITAAERDNLFNQLQLEKDKL